MFLTETLATKISNSKIFKSDSLINPIYKKIYHQILNNKN